MNPKAMRLLKLVPCALLGVSVLSTAAQADGREPGSVLVYPIHRSALFQANVFNVVNVTNTNRAGSGTTNVHFQYVNVTTAGTPFLFANCTISDRVETLTPADTLSVLTSCHNGAFNNEGYLVVSAQNPNLVDTKWSFNYLIGSEQIVSAGGGMYSLNAIPFTSPQPAKADTDVDQDGRLDFNGVEYEGIADELYIDSYIGAIAGELVLISLTGGEYLTNVNFVIYNDDEFQLSAQYSFACWTRTPLAAISGYFTALGLATTPDDPSELDINCDGLQDLDTGWAIVRPTTSLSITSPSISNPAVMGALVNDAAPFMNARLLWESTGKQFNGQFPN
ncbi:MAG: hypothetical protein R3F34_06805 [Planctomycetota bacterium]